MQSRGRIQLRPAEREAHHRVRRWRRAMGRAGQPRGRAGRGTGAGGWAPDGDEAEEEGAGGGGEVMALGKQSGS